MSVASQCRTGHPRGPNATSRPRSATRTRTEEQASTAIETKANGAISSHIGFAGSPSPTSSAASATTPATAASAYSQGFSVRASHTRRSPAGMSIRAPRPGAAGEAGRPLASTPTTAAAAAARTVATAPTVTESASRHCAWWRFARTIEACSPVSSTPHETSTAPRHRRAARQNTAETTSAIQIATGTSTTAQSGSEPSGSPKAFQCVASRSSNPLRAVSGSTTSSARIPAAQDAVPHTAPRPHPVKPPRSFTVPP